MLQGLKLALGFFVALGLVLFALANRGQVTLSLFPEDLALFLDLDLRVQVPLFIVLFLGLVIGLMVGFVWEWKRAHKQRATAQAQKREVKNLHREMESLRTQEARPGDDIIALIEAAEKKK